MELKLVKNTLIISAVLPFIVFIVSPITFFLGNHTEFTASIMQLLSPLLLLGLGSMAIFALLLFLLSSWPSVYRMASAILVSLAVACWVQSQLLVWNFGALDGHSIEWSKWSSQSQMEIAIWLLILASGIYFGFRSKNVSAILGRIGLFLGVLTLLTTWVNSGYHWKTKQTPGSLDHFFSFHKNNNKILIVLDTFQSDVFQEIQQKWPDEVSFLQGFTFYPNTVGGYPTTKASIPLIMTGKFYKNEKPIEEWILSNNQANNLADYLVKKGYGASLTSYVPSTLKGIQAPMIYIKDVQTSEFANSFQNSLLVLDGGLFRLLPTQLKPHIYREGQWFLYTLSSSGAQDEKGPHSDDMRALKSFEDNILVNSQNIGEFKLYHYAGPHLPFDRNEFFVLEKDMPPSRDSFIRQARGSLLFLKRKLATLKRLGIYDSAEILVIGDHGFIYPPIDFEGEIFPNDPELPGDILARARPLFLHKPSASTGQLGVSNRALHLADVVCIFSQGEDVFDCKPYQESAQNDTRIRSFLYYDWSNINWSTQYLPAMREYEISGDVRQKASWQYVYRDFSMGKVYKTNAYTIGSAVKFAKAGNSTPYLGQGWSGAEDNHRWSVGDVGRVVLNLENTADQRLTLRLLAGAFPTKDNGPQPIDVLINGQKIAAWEMSAESKWYYVAIPQELSHSKKLDIQFLIKQPTSPCELHQSEDCRKLGIRAEELIVTKELA